MDDLRQMFADFAALPDASKMIILSALAFIVIRMWLGFIGAWPSRGRDGDGGSGGFGDGDGCD